jgi:hypothetical protein
MIVIPQGYPLFAIAGDGDGYYHRIFLVVGWKADPESEGALQAYLIQINGGVSCLAVPEALFLTEQECRRWMGEVSAPGAWTKRRPSLT